MLTVKFIATAPPGRHLDHRGLYLEVSATGRKRWVLRYSRDKRVTEASLGSVEFVGLAQAREKAFDFRRKLTNGETPATSKVRITFGHVAGDVLAAKVARFKRGSSSESTWHRCLHYLAPLSDRDCQSISVDDVTAILKPLHVAKPSMAERVRSSLEAILDAAKVRGLRTGDNPAKWKETLSHLLPRRQFLSRGHNAAMPYTEVPAFMRRLEQETSVVSLAFRFTILCALRKNETSNLKYSDISNDILIIPPERMKQKREHRVPLCAPALAIIAEQRALGDASELIFPSHNSRLQPLGRNCFNDCLARYGLDFTPHGFRSSFSDWAHDQTEHSVETIEGALAHLVGNAVSRSYRRGDNLDRRRALMNDWAIFLTKATT
jgi:integrase